MVYNHFVGTPFGVGLISHVDWRWEQNILYTAWKPLPSTCVLDGPDPPLADIVLFGLSLKVLKHVY